MFTKQVVHFSMKIAGLEKKLFFLEEKKPIWVFWVFHFFNEFFRDFIEFFLGFLILNFFSHYFINIKSDKNKFLTHDP